jgi:hypothetical protein
MTQENRTLIETFLPVEEISQEAKSEKAGRAPTFKMHYWWTRKPLITARAAGYSLEEFKEILRSSGIAIKISSAKLERAELNNETS